MIVGWECIDEAMHRVGVALQGRDVVLADFYCVLKI